MNLVLIFSLLFQLVLGANFSYKAILKQVQELKTLDYTSKDEAQMLENIKKVCHLSGEAIMKRRIEIPQVNEALADLAFIAIENSYEHLFENRSILAGNDTIEMFSWNLIVLADACGYDLKRSTTYQVKVLKIVYAFAGFGDSEDEAIFTHYSRFFKFVVEKLNDTELNDFLHFMVGSSRNVAYNIPAFFYDKQLVGRLNYSLKERVLTDILRNVLNGIKAGLENNLRMPVCVKYLAEPFFYSIKNGLSDDFVILSYSLLMKGAQTILTSINMDFMFGLVKTAMANRKGIVVTFVLDVFFEQNFSNRIMETELTENQQTVFNNAVLMTLLSGKKNLNEILSQFSPEFRRYFLAAAVKIAPLRNVIERGLLPVENMDIAAEIENLFELTKVDLAQLPIQIQHDLVKRINSAVPKYHFGDKTDADHIVLAVMLSQCIVYRRKPSDVMCPEMSISLIIGQLGLDCVPEKHRDELESLLREFIPMHIAVVAERASDELMLECQDALILSMRYIIQHGGSKAADLVGKMIKSAKKVEKVMEELKEHSDIVQLAIFRLQQSGFSIDIKTLKRLKILSSTQIALLSHLE